MIPDVFGTFINSFSETTAASNQFPGISIGSMMHQAFGIENPISLLLIILFILGLTLAFYESPLFEKAIFIMPTAIAFSPHANTHAIIFVGPMWWYIVCKYYHHKPLTILASNICLSFICLLLPYPYTEYFLNLPVFSLVFATVIFILAFLGIYFLLKIQREPVFLDSNA